MCFVPGNAITSLNPIKQAKSVINNPVGALKRGFVPQKASLKDPLGATKKSVPGANKIL